MFCAAVLSAEFTEKIKHPHRFCHEAAFSTVKQTLCCNWAFSWLKILRQQEKDSKVFTKILL